MEPQTQEPRRRRWHFIKGGQKDKVLTRLKAASPQAVSRDELAALVGRAALKPLIFKMKRLSLIACSPQGYHLPGITPPSPEGADEKGLRLTRLVPPSPRRMPEMFLPTPDHLGQLLGAITRRAHRFREAGNRAEAVRLLVQAAGAPGLALRPHIRADVLALADLFAAHEATYPELDLRAAVIPGRSEAKTRESQDQRAPLSARDARVKPEHDATGRAA